MTSVERLSKIFLAACEREGRERDAYLAQACGGDAALRAKVEALLARDADGSVELAVERLASGGHREANDTPAVDLPEQIGHYRIRDLLGEGGMGVVYRAEQEHPHRIVALKVIQPWAMSAMALRRFDHEVAVLGRLQHPGIAQIFEAGRAGTGASARPYFAMELIDGRPLLQDAEERGLGTRERLALFADICDAVHHAHQKGVIHRDLKPGNILVDASGLPKILDFGIARATDSDLQTVTQHTDVGALVGTVAYMSPEQAGGDPAELDTRSDVYSLGVILYELLSGSLPYDVRGKLLHEAARVVREDDPTPISTRDRLLRGDVDAIVSTALRKEKERRYQSAQEFADDIRRYLRSEPIVARPPTTAYQLRKFTSRNKVLVASVAAVILALGTGLTVAGLALAKERVARETAEVNEQIAHENEVAAKAARRLAEQRLGDFTRISDLKRLADLRARAEAFWPSHPDKAVAMEQWLVEARALEERLGVHEATLQELRAKSLSGSEAEGFVFASIEDDWMHEQLATLVIELAAFVSGGRAGATLRSVEHRLHSAQTIRQRSIGAEQAAWDQAIASIEAGPRYGGLAIRPQLGLVPLGEDRDSGLWEFWLVESGDRPLRVPSDAPFVIEPETGMVLVLIPGGTFWMGAQNDGPDLPNYDRLHTQDDEDPHEVTLDPYLLSKYEMTQAQWERLLGSNPSLYNARHRFTPRGHVHPVEHVSWFDGVEALLRLGLQLPTEAQWERAVRAETDTPWWCGWEGSCLQGAANLADTSFGQHFNSAYASEPWNDGFVVHAPVGSFAPNPYGLHDLYGNVGEWCQDRFLHYSVGVRPGDGLRASPDETAVRGHVYRGGSSTLPAKFLRSSQRSFVGPEFREAVIGVRAARALDP